MGSRRSKSRSHRGTRGSTASNFRQLPWRAIENPYPPMPLLSTDQLEAIHHASMEILRDIGIHFMHEDAKYILKTNGATVEVGSDLVRFDPELVEQSIATAPTSFTLHARAQEHDLVMGGNRINFAAVASAPYASDMERGRRTGSFADFKDFLRLIQSCDIIHLAGGYPCEPIDLPPETRHLDCSLAFAELTDKVWHAYSLGRQRVIDCLDMLCIARGRTREQIAGEPSLFSVINTSSPLRVDGPMLEGIMELSAHGQVIVVTPFTLAGAMAPVTLAGALAQQNAEALATIAFTQMVRPGAPVVYGGFTSNVDMRSGAPAFGTPEYARATLIGAQLARRYHLPYRSSNANAANIPDAQSAYEAMMSLWPVTLGHANLVMHGAGWMEGGLTASFEKFMIDVEMLQMMAVFLEPVSTDPAELALEAVREVGPGGHFFGAAHTLERYQTAFHEPILSDWRNYESWEEAGAPTTLRRANELYKKVLGDYQPPPLDPGIREHLTEFVAKRKSGENVA